MTQDELKEWLHYDPKTGWFVWLKKPAKCILVGSRAGTVDVNGYRYIVVGGKRRLEHRLAWLYMTGEWPFEEIDHRRAGKEFRSDNRWSELRPATKSQNGGNRLKKAGTSSCFKGVSWKQARLKWKSQIWVAGKSITLGYFVSEKAAHAAYAAAARETFKEFARV